jgi:hypothetical protein
MKKGMIFYAMLFELLATVLVCMWVGGIIDTHYGWPNYAMMGLVLTGLILWMVRLIIMAKRLNDEPDEPGKTQ